MPHRRPPAGGHRFSAPISALRPRSRLSPTRPSAHGLELDDTHDVSVSHPGAVVIATALAVAADSDAPVTGQTLCAAIAAGYETMARVGAAVGAGDMIEHGFHPTAVFGSFGATTAAALVAGLDARGVTAAWGLALSMTGGSMQFSEDADAPEVKRLHGGIAAQRGCTAADLSRLGLQGPSRAFDGRYGALRLFGGPGSSADRLTDGLDEPQAIDEISYKPYPCCRLFHAGLDALSEVTDGFSLPRERIEKLVFGGPQLVIEQHMQRRPGSKMAAQYSLPFTVAAALIDGPESVDGFAVEALASSERHALCDIVEAEPDAEFQSAFPAHFGMSVRLHLSDGQTRSARVLDSLGTARRPMDTESLKRKFERLNGGQTSLDADALLAAVRTLLDSGDARGFLQRIVDSRRGEPAHSTTTPE